MINHLTQNFFDNNISTSFQPGFKNMDSTVNQLLFLYHEFSKTLDANKEIRVVFVTSVKPLTECCIVAYSLNLEA